MSEWVEKSTIRLDPDQLWADFLNEQKLELKVRCSERAFFYFSPGKLANSSDMCFWTTLCRRATPAPRVPARRDQRSHCKALCKTFETARPDQKTEKGGHCARSRHAASNRKTHGRRLSQAKCNCNGFQLSKFEKTTND